MQILIVDDDPQAAGIVKKIADGKGRHFVTVETGREAMDRIQKDHFDLIFLDVYLPDAMAQDLIPKIRKIHPDVLIITMTGYNNAELEAQIRKQGISYYLIKPFDRKEIISLLDHFERKSVSACTS